MFKMMEFMIVLNYFIKSKIKKHINQIKRGKTLKLLMYKLLEFITPIFFKCFQIITRMIINL